METVNLVFAIISIDIILRKHIFIKLNVDMQKEYGFNF